MSAVRRVAIASGAAGLVCLLLSACVATGVDVDGSVGVGYDAGYYEPWGYEYGGWGPDYRVGPGRGGDRRGDHPSHGYRPAPASRPAPSIPRGPRGGGGPHGGGAPHR